jgi:hypothetical protein
VDDDLVAKEVAKFRTISGARSMLTSFVLLLPDKSAASATTAATSFGSRASSRPPPCHCTTKAPVGTHLRARQGRIHSEPLRWGSFPRCLRSCPALSVLSSPVTSGRMAACEALCPRSSGASHAWMNGLLRYSRP